MYEKIEDKISVDVVFRASERVEVKKFFWDKKIYEISSLNLWHRMNRGNEFIYLFSVSNDTATFNIRFHTSDLSWWLESVYWD